MYKQIRLFRNPKKGSYLALKRILGFFPKDLSLYEEALIHKSSSVGNGRGTYINNERLEFLGDAILDSIVADVLFKKFPTQREGFLTNTRSKIVKRETLDRIARELGLNNLIISDSRVQNQKNHILGNALEAFIGAIYLDQGYRKTYRFINERIIAPFIDIDTVAKKEVNFKSKLLEWSQKNRVRLDYELIENFVDNSRNPVFQTQVLLNGLVGGVGTGNSKKESQQQASELALKKIKRHRDFVVEVLSLNETEPEPEVVQEEEESEDLISNEPETNLDD